MPQLDSTIGHRVVNSLPVQQAASSVQEIAQPQGHLISFIFFGLLAGAFTMVILLILKDALRFAVNRWYVPFWLKNGYHPPEGGKQVDLYKQLKKLASGSMPSFLTLTPERLCGQLNSALDQ